MRTMRPPMIAFWGLLAVGATPAGWTAVTGLGPSGFSLKIETTVTGTPADAYNRFMQIGRWWNPAHSYSGDAANLALSAKPGGCFCETLPGGGFVKHMDVVYAAPGKTLRLTGGLGPLQGMGATGAMTFEFKAEGATTHVTATYVVTGFVAGQGFATLAPAVDGVLAEQLGRFKHFAETGKPTG